MAKAGISVLCPMKHSTLTQTTFMYHPMHFHSLLYIYQDVVTCLGTMYHQHQHISSLGYLSLC